MSDAAASAGSSLRQDQVVAATRSLFLRYGYRRTSVDDIAREAGVAKATLYLHFAGKEDMFRTMIRRFREVMNEHCDSAEALDLPIEARLVALLYANYGITLEWFGDAAHISELKAFVSEHPIGPFDDSAPAFRERVLRMLAGAVERGELKRVNPVPLEDVVRTIIWASVGAKKAQKDGSQDMRHALKTIVTLVIGGMVAR